MEEGNISESTPIMAIGANNTTIMNNNSSLTMTTTTTTTKPLDVARVLKNLVIFSTIGVAFIILYYASYTNFGQLLSTFSSHGVSSSDEIVLKDYEYNALKNVLKAASTEENTVVLTTLNEAWAEPNSIFDLFLGSFKTGNGTSWLLNHLLVIAMDDKAYVQCNKLVSHCYLLKTKQSPKMAHEARFMTPIYLDMMWKRLALLQTVLSLGYNFVFTDSDVMWFRDPFPHFIPESDFQTSCDHFNGDEFDIRNSPNNGFLFVQSNKRTIQFYKYWVASRSKFPHLHDQDVFNKIKKDYFVKQIGIKLRFLDTVYFGGFCEPSKDFNKVCTMHANCCVGLVNKISDCYTTIKAWKKYLSSTTLQQPFYWGVPKKCHM